MIATSSSSAKVKHLVDEDNKKIDGMQNVRDILLKSSTKKLKNVICLAKMSASDLHNLPRSRGPLTFLTKVRFIYISRGIRIELGKLLLYLTSTRHMPSCEKSSVELVHHH